MQKPVRISLQLERRYKFFPKKAKFFAKNHKTKRNNDPPGPFQPLHDRFPKHPEQRPGHRLHAKITPTSLLPRQPGQPGGSPPTVKRKEEGKAKRPNPQSPKRPARKLLPGSATKCDRLQTSPNKGIPARVRRTFRSAPQPLP